MFSAAEWKLISPRIGRLRQRWHERQRSWTEECRIDAVARERRPQRDLSPAVASRRGERGKVAASIAGVGTYPTLAFGC